MLFYHPLSYPRCPATVPSPCPPLKLSLLLHLHPPTSATSLMEEAWKDLSVSPKENEYSLTSTSSTLLRSYSNFHDFLARPSAGDLPLVSSTLKPGSTCLPPPITMPTLNSGREIHFQRNPDSLRVTSQFEGFLSSSSSSSAFSAFGKRRFSQPEGNSGDRRHRRLVKNRESAARSRARKQAYTNELELEVAHLMEENARLRRQQDQVSLDASATQHPRKPPFQRSSTAPF